MRRGVALMVCRAENEKGAYSIAHSLLDPLLDKESRFSSSAIPKAVRARPCRSDTRRMVRNFVSNLGDVRAGGDFKGKAKRDRPGALPHRPLRSAPRGGCAN